MNKLYYIIIGLLLVGTSCEKEEITNAVQLKIDEFANGTYACTTGASVKKYLFQDENVYVLDPGICGADYTSEVIDDDGNTLGQLGGIIGNAKINGENFSSAVFIKTLWKN
jgi:hypothetical protein